MSIRQIATQSGAIFSAVADDDAAALDRGVSAGFLIDGDSGSIEEVPEPEGLEPYEPETPG